MRTTLDKIRARHEEGIRAGADADRAYLLAEVERLTRERDESKSKETDYREGFDEGWAAAQKGAVDEVEKLRAALKFYAHEYCELGEAFEGCGKLLVEQCGGCLARAALEAKS